MTSSALGVVIVSFNSSTELLDCIESLLSAEDVRLHIVVVDNASTDNTLTLFENWASGHTPYVPAPDIPITLGVSSKPIEIVTAQAAAPTTPQITLIRSEVNLGFAGGVNIGLKCLASNPDIDRFWVLNPDCVTPPETPRAFATYQPPEGRFSLLGGRVIYLYSEAIIQTDGGKIAFATGVTHSINQGLQAAQTTPPDLDQIDFISGASMVASRAFYEAAGPMPEDYFLYYEEVDWALRRGDQPLALCPEALTYHRAGTAIGSHTLTRMATPFSFYFLYRARMKFLRRHAPRGLAGALTYGMLKAFQIALKGYRAEAIAILRGCWGAGPSRETRECLSPEAARIAFGEKH